MTAYEFCKVEREGRLTIVTLNRPEVMNALHAAAHAELGAVFDDFATVLATLHQVDVDRLDLVGFARPTTTREHSQLDIEMWQRLSNGVTSLDPLCAYAGGWLHEPKPGCLAPGGCASITS